MVAPIRDHLCPVSYTHLDVYKRQAYIFLIEPIGFIPASILFVSGILAFFKSKKILYYVVCIGIVVAVYFGFRLFLKVYLP